MSTLDRTFSGAEVGTLLGVSRQAVSAWRAAGCPASAPGRFALPAVVEWLRQRDREAWQAEQLTGDARERWEHARASKVEAEAKLAALDVADREGGMIAVEIHREVVGEFCDRMRGVLQNAPSTFAVDLERLGITAADAQAVLEKIAEALTACLRDAMDDEPDADA